MGQRDRRRYGNRGRDQNNFEQVHGDVLLQSSQRDREQELLATLLKQGRNWAEATLAGQLHHAVKLNLQKETQPQQVRPWSMKVKVPRSSQPSQILAPEISIGQVFDQCSGRLLILGEPGAGKTTSLLDLAIELYDKAESDQQERIPVMVDLAEWQPNAPQSNPGLGKEVNRLLGLSRKSSADLSSEQVTTWSFADWLAYEVGKRYGSPQKIQQWLAEKRLVPLLDGLDEVRPEYQQDCVRAINQWLNSDVNIQVGLCCRREQYEDYSEKLELEGAVYLQDLTDEQIQIFLRDANRSELWESVVADANLLELIRKPLLLSMATVAYVEIKPSDWHRTTSAGDRLNLLLDSYIQAMLTTNRDSRAYGNGKIPSPEQSRKWLEILALQLLQDSQAEFLIERIQPIWLSTSVQKCLHVLLAIIVWGLIVGLLFSGFSVTISVFWYGVGFAYSLFGVLIASKYIWNDLQNLKLVQPIRISLFNLKPQQVVNTFLDWKYGWVPSLIYFVISGIIYSKWNFSDLLFGFTLVVIAVIISEAITDINRSEYTSKLAPNQGIWNSLWNIIPITGTFVLLWIPIRGLTRYLNGIPFISLSSLIQTFSLALGVWILIGSGYIFIQHLLVRLCLFATDSTPWDYARFLDYATERLLLQRVGGQYRFMHDLLRQSLAQLRIDSHPHLISSPVLDRCGESCRSRGEYKLALKYFDRAIELDPQYKSAIANRGRVYRSMREYDRSVQDFSKLIELNPKNAEAFAGRGETYRLMESYGDALKDFDRAIELSPKYEFALISRGQVYQEIGQYDKALKDFNYAIELDPKDFDLIIYRGRVYRSIKQYENALQDFKNIIKQDPKNAEAFAGRGETYRLMESYGDALKDFDRAIELVPKYGWAIAQRGYVYLLIGQYDDTLKDLDYAIKLDSEDDFSFYYRALAYLALHQDDRAKSDLATAIHLAQKKHTKNPTDCHNTLNLALYYLVLDNIQTAQDFYKIAINHNASKSEIRDAIQDLEDLLKVINDSPLAEQMKVELSQHLKSIEP